ncbi:TVP38/TMEM64 family protein [Echinicola shivajiensis]|uniref:TVP38/TMEM64 family protein n=1 Tax=Echinicola shivajiensis TaxID=1035916 RepID=UPI001BFCCB48|nr:VTT domain-containing protein [Echinicola shivajiensis]
MPKKEAFFNRIKLIYQENPAIGISMIWVLVFPAIGSTILLSYVYSSDLVNLANGSFGIALLLTCLGAIIMGLALAPTTLLAILSGFLWGWSSFPFVVISCSVASLIGYFIGCSLDHNSLQHLLANYPKAARLVEEKKSKMGSLIFFVRISPVIPFALSNLLFALLKTGWKSLLIYGLIGMLPRSFMAFSAGLMASSISEAFEKKEGGTQVLLIIVLLIISIWGIIRFFKKSSSRK